MAKQSEKREVREAEFSDEQIADMIEKFLAIEGPNEKLFERLYAFIQRYFAPTIVGVENIPDKPTLFIGNHAMFGLEDYDIELDYELETVQQRGVMSEFVQIAAAGGGDGASLAGDRRVVRQLALVIFGERWSDDMQPLLGTL